MPKLASAGLVTITNVLASHVQLCKFDVAGIAMFTLT